MNVNIANARQKIIEIDGRRFQVSKYDAITGLKIAKLFIAKILPIMQSFLPVISQAASGDASVKDDILSELDKYLNFEGIAKALDLVSPEDLDFIIQNSLMNCHEILSAGLAQVMNANKTYGVQNVEHDILIVLRLTCETIMLGVGDFFDGDRLGLVMSPLFSSLPLNQPT